MKILKSLLLGLLVVSIVGCGNSGKNDSKAKNNNVKSNTETNVNVKNDSNKENSKGEEKQEEKTDNEKVTKLESINNVEVSNITYKISETEKDEKLEKAIRKAYDIKADEELNSRYYYNKIDLNGDDKPESFVYLVGTFFSGSGGSSAVIFESGEEDEYKLVSKFTLVNAPVVISENKTNKWNDIIMPVYGGGAESFYAVMKFDGKEYPLNPSVQPAFEGTELKGTAIIADEISTDNGISF